MIGYVLISESGRCYVGITKDFNRRIREHRSSGPMSSQSFSVIEKHIFSDRESASLWEIREIEARGAENLLNTSLGGYGGRKRSCSESERQRLSVLSIERYKDPSYRRKMGDSVKRAYQNPEIREKLSCAQKRVCACPEVKAKRSLAQKAAWADPEIRARRLASLQVANSDPEKSEKRSLAAKRRWEERKARA